MTKKQKQELDFFKKTYKIQPTEQEIEQYFNWTVKGKDGDIENIRSKNCLFQKKRSWDMQLKMFNKDRHLFPLWELIEDYDHPYATKCLTKLYDKTTQTS